MRSWKIAFAVTAVAVIVVIAFVVVRRGDSLIGGTAGAATPSPASFAMPVPVIAPPPALCITFPFTSPLIRAINREGALPTRRDVLHRLRAGRGLA